MDLKLVDTAESRAKLKALGIDPQKVVEAMADIELKPLSRRPEDGRPVWEALGLSPQSLLPAMREDLLNGIHAQSSEDRTSRRVLMENILTTNGFQSDAAPKLLAVWGIGEGPTTPEQRGEMAVCAGMGLDYVEFKRSQNLLA